MSNGAVNTDTDSRNHDFKSLLSLPITEIRRRTRSIKNNISFKHKSNRNKSADHLLDSTLEDIRKTSAICLDSRSHERIQDQLKGSNSAIHFDSNFSFSNNSFVNFFRQGMLKGRKKQHGSQKNLNSSFKVSAKNNSKSRSMKDMNRVTLDPSKNALRQSDTVHSTVRRKISNSYTNLTESDILKMTSSKSFDPDDKKKSHYEQKNVSVYILQKNRR